MLAMSSEVSVNAGGIAAFGFITVLFSLLPLIVSIVCAVVVNKNAKKFSEAAWQQSGQNKTLWVVLAFFFNLLGLLIYFLAIKPKVEEAQQRMQGGQVPPMMMPPR